MRRLAPTPRPRSRSPDRVREAVLALDIGDARYPPKLRDLPDPPPRLWYIGDLSLLDGTVVAIVGTRAATAYGERIARELSASFVRAGAVVISGMARGIDGVAHFAALDAGGRTAAVLGTGVDVPYPRSHTALHRRIAGDGLLLAELPPGAHSHGGSFLRRNRLIAALARLVLIVEAPAKSGALNTSECAMDLGRDVGAVPGPIDAPQSVGCNELIRTGAHPITSVADALALADLTPAVRMLRDPSDPDELRVWRALRRGAVDLDTLCARASLPAQRCLAAVTALELRGSVECCLTGEIRRR